MLQLKSAWTILLRRGITRGCMNLWRDRDWGGSLGALCGVFLLVQMLCIGLIVAGATENMLRERTDLRLEVREGVTDSAINGFYDDLQALDFIDDVSFITSEQAYDRARRDDPQLVGFLEEYGLENPFRDTIAVTLTSLSHYREFLSFLKQERWQRVVDPAFLSEATDQERYIESLLHLTHGVGSIVLIVLGVGIGALLFIVTELTRTQALVRSEEVLVERLAGAPSLSIIVPFATEACALLIASIIGSAAIAVGVTLAMPIFVPALGEGGVLQGMRDAVAPMLLLRIPLAVSIQILSAPAIAMFGAWLGMERQLRSPRIAIA